jgi:hypothetical protein
MLDLEKVVSRPRICYELPLSKVVQSLKKNGKVETSWDVARTFLRSCTNARVECPARLVLTINKHDERDTSHLENEATRLFDAPATHFDGLYEQLKWTLEARQLAPAIDLMTRLQPYPPATRPCISLRIDYEFEFVHVETGENLEHQEDPSRLAIFLAKNSHVMAEFCFPFSTVQDFRDYLSTIEDLLPFQKLDKKAFRLIAPNKNKTGNVIRKISID